MEHSGHLLMGFITGALFGFVLFKVGAIRYYRVEGLLLLKDLKIMKFAFIAIATASIIYGLADIFGVAQDLNLIPRIMPYMGIAHLVGGVLFGIGMASAGFCPGTCFARIGSGKFVAIAGVIGIVLGILLYATLKPVLVDIGILGTKEKLTLYGILGLPYGVLAVVWGVLFIIMALVADWVDPAKKLGLPEEKYDNPIVGLIRGEWGWALSGFLAGSIIAWATAQGEYLGFSGGALALIGWISHLIGHPLDIVPKITETILWHAGLILGVIPGAFVAAIISGKFKFDLVPPAFAKAISPLPWVRMAVAFVAGIIIAFGAMVGGGCTTGAFISAYPTLSIGSMVMSGTYFTVGIIFAHLIYLGKLDKFLSAKKESDEVYD